MSTVNVKAQLAEHIATLDLLNRYTDAINQRDWAQLRAVFAQDSVWDMGGPAVGPMAMRFEGNGPIAAGIAASVSTAAMCVQTNHAPVVVVDGGRATARSTIHELFKPTAGGGYNIIGTYYDDLVLDHDGEWRFRERRFRITYVDSETPVPGQVLATFPRTQD